jgi:hypothetical protein
MIVAAPILLLLQSDGVLMVRLTEGPFGYFPVRRGVRDAQGRVKQYSRNKGESKRSDPVTLQAYRRHATEAANGCARRCNRRASRAELLSHIAVTHQIAVAGWGRTTRTTRRWAAAAPSPGARRRDCGRRRRALPHADGTSGGISRRWSAGTARSSSPGTRPRCATATTRRR